MHCLWYHTYIYHVRNTLPDAIVFAYGRIFKAGNGNESIMGRTVEMDSLEDEREVDNYAYQVNGEKGEEGVLITAQQLTGDICVM